MNRTDRLYAIAAELRAAGPRGRTGQWLADRFEVSTRTVKRDVDALLQAGEPIWATAGPGGGYVLDGPAATMPPVPLTAAEATAVALALATAADLPFLGDGRSALRKVLDAMPAAERDRAAGLASRLWLRTEDPPTRPAVRRVVEEAIRRQVVLVLDYTDGTGSRTEHRLVEPMVLARTRGRWYLLAWCRRRRAGRWFRLDRIAAADPTTEPTRARDLRAVFGAPPADAHPLAW